MATKTELIDSIGTALSIVINRAKVLLGFDKVIDELYPTEVSQVISSGSVTCNLRYISSGNQARVIGFIKNNTNAIIGNTSLVPLVDVVYAPKVIAEIFTIGNVTIEISETNISLIGNMGANQIIRINESYQIND